MSISTMVAFVEASGYDDPPDKQGLTSKYISDRRGECQADTSSYGTTFLHTIRPEFFEQSIELFSWSVIFTSTFITKEIVERELAAVDNECSERSCELNVELIVLCKLWGKKDPS